MAPNNTFGALRVVNNSQIAESQKALADAKKASETVQYTELAGYIRTSFEVMKRHRNDGAAGWSERLLNAMRVFNGVYDAQKLAEIKEFGGSTVYARIIAMKCRGAHALLRDVYLSPQRPWALDPPADPDVPPEIQKAIAMLIESEVAGTGAPPDVNMIRDRTMQLMEAAKMAATKQAERRAKMAEDKIEEILENGNFYTALSDFLVDLPLFPFACLKGPTVRIVPTVKFENGQVKISNDPRLFWNRVSPFDVWWTPGVNDIEDGDMIERSRLTRADLNDLLDLPGYNHDAVRTVLDEYGQGGLNDDIDTTDSERAAHENRENPNMNRSNLINCLEFHGNIQGKMLIQYGMEGIEDELRDYFVQAWLIGRHVIKVQMSPSPRKRHPYFITSFEKVPGTPVGNGLPDILNDIQDVCNATLRSLVNNMSIASGPQVVVNYERLHSSEDGQNLYPWKKWMVTSDPMGNQTQQPISFFQPNSNAQELLGVYQKFTEMADELSAIPKYLSGEGAGGAGRTASGLAMLMGNASKILQTVASNVDRDVVSKLLQQLLDMIMMTDATGLLSGNETLRVMGVTVAVQKETQRARQIEFLQATANPIDAQIIGPRRANILRAVASTIGMDGDQIVPSDDEIKQAMAAATQGAPTGPDGAPQPGMAEAGAQAQGGQQGPAVTKDMGPRTNLQQTPPKPSGGVQ